MEATPIKRSELKGHLARTAANLFYRYGIHAVGVDRIADTAGVTKKTLYHHYASKDDLIAAALRSSPIVLFPESGSPSERILGAFARLREFLADTNYRGCPYIFFTAELVDRNHPAHQIVKRRIARRRAWFAQWCEADGAADHATLAEQLDVLFDGALASATKREDLAPVDAAVAAAKALLDLSRQASSATSATMRAACASSPSSR